MRNIRQKGFSLIELLMVLVIIGVIVAISSPFVLKAKFAAENGNALGSLKTMHSTQLSYRAQNTRFGRLTELNSFQGGALGTISGNDLIRGKFTFQMSPVNPTDVDLRDNFVIVATKAQSNNELPYVISVDQSGYITDILP